MINFLSTKMTRKLFSIILAFMVSSTLAFTASGKFQLNYIGTVEGKSYFTEQNISLTWLEAKAFCNASGMDLGSIETYAESGFLQNAFNIVTFHEWVWTGGRDSQKPSQFSWDTNGEILDSTLHRRMVFDDIQTCLYYNPSPQQHFLHAATCTTKLTGIY